MSNDLFLNCSFIALQETWWYNNITFFNFQDFRVYKINALKSVGPGRAEGGLIILVNNNLESEILIQKQDLVFLKLIIENEVYILGTVYFKPATDPNCFVRLSEALDVLETQYFNSKIIIGGDFNTRIGLLNQIQEEEIEGSKLMDYRISKDRKEDGSSGVLMDILEERGFTVLNGRSISDPCGEFTFVGPMGRSVIDLVWVNSNLLHSVHDFEVVTDVTPSDHFPCKLSLDLNWLSGIGVEQEEGQRVITKIKWDDKSTEEYQRELNLILSTVQSNKQPEPDLQYKNFVEAIKEVSGRVGLVKSYNVQFKGGNKKTNLV